jgi:hypothetical protein
MSAADDSIPVIRPERIPPDTPIRMLSGGFVVSASSAAMGPRPITITITPGQVIHLRPGHQIRDIFALRTAAEAAILALSEECAVLHQAGTTCDGEWDASAGDLKRRYDELAAVADRLEKALA